MALICMDLDGTTLHKGKPVKGIVESIKALKENGHHVAIATGRSPMLLYDLDKTLGVDELILANGSYVTVKGKVIFESYIDKDVVKKVMDFVDTNKTDLVIEYLDNYVAYRRETDLPDRFSDLFDIPRADFDNSYDPDRNVFSMFVFDDSQVEIMKVIFPELDFNRSNEFGYDVNLKGGLKADGVIALAKYLNYSMDEVYAIGDGYNDKTMLEAVKFGIAMGNANEDLKAIADYVTTDVNDYGVMNALKHYGLI